MSDPSEPTPLDAPIAGEPPDLFVSYARADIDFVRRLDAALRARGKDVWVDYDDIRPTEEWWPRICSGIDGARAFVSVLSPSMLESEICRRELAHAVASHKRIVPILRSEIDASRAPEELSAPNWIFFRDQDDFGRSLETLADALGTDLEWLDQHARLLVRAKEWGDKQRDRSLVLRGRELADAERWLSEQSAHAELPTALQAEYIAAGRIVATRRQRFTLGTVTAALAISVGLSIFALVQRSQAIANAKVARSRELASSAFLALSSDPQEALKLAIEAARVRHTDEAAEALRRSILEAHDVAVLETPKPLQTATFSPDGTLVAAGGDDGIVRIWSAGGRLLRTLRGHYSSVRTAAFSPDGKRLLTAGDGSAARIWPLAGGSPIVLPETEGLIGAAFSPGGRLVLTASGHFDGRAALWDATTGKALAVLPRGRASSEPLSAAAFSPDGRLVAAGDNRGHAWVWQAPSGRLVRALPRRSAEAVNAVAIGPAGRVVVVAGADGEVRVWRPDEGAAITVLDGRDGPVRTVAVSPNGRLIATGALDGVARLWEVGGRTSIALHGHDQLVTGVAFSRDGKLLLTRSRDRTARIWETASGAEVAVLRGHGGAVSSAALRADAKLVVTASVDGTVRIWHTGSALDVATVSSPLGVASASFSPTGDRLATGGQRGQVRLWDTASGKRLPLRCDRPQQVSSVAFDPAGTLLLTSSSDGTATLCPTEGGRPVVLRGGVLPSGLALPLRRAVFSRDGSLVAAVGDDPNVRVWQVRGGKLVALLEGHEGPVLGVVFNVDGSILTTAGDDGTVRLWSLPSGRQLRVLRLAGAAPVSAVAFSPDGSSVVVAAGNGAAGLVRVPDGRALARPLLLGQALTVAGFSPDGELVVLGGADGGAWIWRPRRGSAVRLQGHATEVFVVTAAFSTDGRLVLTASEDGTARLWTPDGKPIATLRGHSGPLSGAALSPGGKLIVTAGQTDGIARIFACAICGSIDDLVGRACRRLVRESPLCAKDS